ncbi:hypothetical protein COF67_25445 [Bacillus toyonensis]|uniref:hypothetical protein n=1 Tax=Bacillus toyonensis TaxID=155322 RepID=UPI000BFE8527|nr:hypothetical protein [Bacillus toyonensis]PHD44863.1 hypothetical protein COF67_25445 [Bacillus toyonensis]
MRIHYDKNEVDFETVKDLANIFNSKNETVELKVYGDRKSALDLISIIEVVGIFFGTKALEGFVEGLVGKEHFFQLGKKVQETLSSNLVQLYKKIGKYKDKKHAVVIGEYYKDTYVFAVINHYEINESLLIKLPLAIVDVFNIIENDIIPKDSLGVIQIFPDFDREEWSYAFIPTIEAYGNYIDRYYDFHQNCFHKVLSAEEFITKFVPNELDVYKFMITFNRVNNQK